MNRLLIAIFSAFFILTTPVYADTLTDDAPRDDDEVGPLPILNLLTLEQFISIRPQYDYRPWPGQWLLT